MHLTREEAEIECQFLSHPAHAHCWFKCHLPPCRPALSAIQLARGDVYLPSQGSATTDFWHGGRFCSFPANAVVK